MGNISRISESESGEICVGSGPSSISLTTLLAR